MKYLILSTRLNFKALQASVDITRFGRDLVAELCLNFRTILLHLDLTLLKASFITAFYIMHMIMRGYTHCQNCLCVIVWGRLSNCVR